MSGPLENLPRVAFWLVPSRQERQTLQSQIVKLSDRFKAPVFVPHVTVYSCRRTPEQKELAVLAALAGSCQPFAVRPAGLACSDRLTQALSIRLPAHPSMVRLSRALHAQVAQPSAYHLAPHLSLLYRELAVGDQDILLREVPLCVAEISFDSLWAVAIPERISTWNDLYGWQPLLILRLDSGGIAGRLDN